MAKYTTEVRSICEVNAGLTESKGFDDIESIITNAAPKIFGTNWPIFDENYRLVLEKIILRHYYTREISEETVGLWKLRLVDRLNLIMPYYNQLYESEKLKFEPLNDVDYTDTGNRKGNTKSSGTANTETSGTQDTTRNGTQNTTYSDKETVDRSLDDSQWQLYSDTPQGGVIGIANAEGSVGDNAYLTNAQHNTQVLKEDIVTDRSGKRDTTTQDKANTNTSGNSDTTTTGNVDTVDDYTEHIAGKRGSTSYSRMLKEFRETFLNINMRIVDDLNDLFFGLWE